MQLKAYAKLNLALEILSQREDGFHELKGVMQTISLFDTLTIEKADTLTLSVPGRADLQGEDNLVLKAAGILAGEQKLGAHLTLTKNIPHGAGLGGGSSDAAITLMALNKFWNLGYSRTQLWSLAGSLGSDVPFFLTGGSAEVAGRGEIIKPLPEGRECWFALVHPPFSISTAWAYRAFDANSQPASGSTERVKAALGRGDLQSLGRAFGNNLEGPVFAGYPQLEQYKQGLLDAGAFGAAMSGSGSTIFGLFPSKEAAQQGGDRLVELWPDLEINVVRTISRQKLTQEKARFMEKLGEKE